MNKQVEKTKLFHCKQGFPLKEDLTKHEDDDEKTTAYLDEIANEMLTSATMIENKMKTDGGYDLRLARTQLMMEELGETILGLAYRDEIATLDGLSDLSFVTIGTAVSYDLPLIEGLNAVCDSNLTKSPHAKDDKRVRDKGPDYRSPNLKRVLSLHRGVKVNAHRTSCVEGGQTYNTSVLVKRRFSSPLNAWWIYVAEGGATGYESMRVEDVPNMKEGWGACAGTKNRWDKLFLPAESMQKIQNWLKQ